MGSFECAIETSPSKIGSVTRLTLAGKLSAAYSAFNLVTSSPFGSSGSETRRTNAVASGQQALDRKDGRINVGREVVLLRHWKFWLHGKWVLTDSPK